MEKIKIIEIIGESTLSGGSTSFLTLVRGLNKKRFDVSCIAPPGPLVGRLKEIKDVEVFTIPMRSKWDFAAIRKIRKTIIPYFQFSAPVIIHCHGTRGGLLGRLASIGSFQNPPKVVYTEHLWTREYRLANPFSHFGQLFFLWFLDLFTDMTIAVSSAVADFLLEKRITLPQKITVVYNGIELKERKKAHPKPGKKEINIGFVGSLTKRKGVEYLLRAFAKLQPRSAKLLIVGEGEEKKSLLKLAENLGIKEKIEFTGIISDISTIYPTLDVYVQPSIDEAFGIAVLEAMSFGVPVVASRVGGLCEILKDVSDKSDNKPFVKTELGLLVPPKNPSALAEALKYMIAHKDFRETAAKNGQKRAKLFSAENMVQSIEKIYTTLVKTPKKL